jgi:hypothetical protein
MTPLPKQFTGDDPLVDPLNRMLQNIRENQVLDGDSVKWERRNNGVRPVVRIPRIEGASELGQFAVVSEFANHLVCQRATCDLTTDSSGRVFTLDGEDVRIAKPPDLRPALFDTISRGGTLIGAVNGYRYTFAADGKTRVAQLVDGAAYGAESITWNQTLLPPYVLTLPSGSGALPDKNIIYAAKMDGTIARVSETVGVTTTSYDVEWIDVNVAARRFETNNKKIRICVEGSAGPYFALIPASEGFQEE